MDPLNSIGMGMAAIVAAWVGYFIGNVAPFFGKAKKYQLERKTTGKKLFDLQKMRREY